MARTTVHDLGYARIKRELLKLEKSVVEVGILGESARYADPDSDGFTLVDVAIVNEFGSEDGHIPERPAHRQTYNAKRNDLKKRIAGSVRLIAEGKVDTGTQLDRLGLWYTGELKDTIRQFNDPPNAPSTVRQKGANNPLVDTGRMLNSINHEVSSRGR